MRLWIWALYVSMLAWPSHNLSFGSCNVNGIHSIEILSLCRKEGVIFSEALSWLWTCTNSTSYTCRNYQELACRNYQELDVRERKCPSYLQSHSLEVLVHPIPLNRKVLALYILLSICGGLCESCMPLLPYLLQDWCSQTKVHECCNSLLQMKSNWILIHIEIPIHLSNMRHLTTVSTHRTSP